MIDSTSYNLYFVIAPNLRYLPSCMLLKFEPLTGLHLVVWMPLSYSQFILSGLLYFHICYPRQRAARQFFQYYLSVLQPSSMCGGLLIVIDQE